MYGLLVLLERACQGSHKLAHITRILNSLVVKLLMFAQIIGPVPHVGTLVAEVLHPLVEGFLVAL